MPSGKLWMPIARAVISPIRISFGIFRFLLQLFDHMGFVRVLDRRHQPVDDADQQYAAEKGQGRNTHPGLGSVDGSDSLPCLLEQFDERT